MVSCASGPATSTPSRSHHDHPAILGGDIEVVVPHDDGIASGDIQVVAPRHEHPAIDDGGTDVIATTVSAEEAITAKWEALGRAPGKPLFDGPDGLIQLAHGFKRNYSKGTIYWKSYGTAYCLDMSTDVLYDQLGGPRSFLGWPLSDFVPDPDDPGSGVTRFEGGAIYYWPDLGAIEMREVALRFVGFHCFRLRPTRPRRRTRSTSRSASFRPSSSSRAPTRRGLSARWTLASRTVTSTPWSSTVGLPPERPCRSTLVGTTRATPTSTGISSRRASTKRPTPPWGARPASPVVGAVLVVVGGFVLEVVKPALTDAINGLIGTGDDLIGTVLLALTPATSDAPDASRAPGLLRCHGRTWSRH